MLAPNGKLVGPSTVFGEDGMFDKDVEEKTKLAFKVTMKKLEKYNVVSECNKEHLKTYKVDQIVECFPNTLLKLLPNEIQKRKWTKKSKEVRYARFLQLNQNGKNRSQHSCLLTKKPCPDGFLKM